MTPKNKQQAPRPDRVVGPGFHEQVYRAVQSVPAGHVITYGDVAAFLGSPQVARHVGWALSALRKSSENAVYNHESVPWHRVINAKGMISARDDRYRGQLQINKLKTEGLEVSNEGRIDLRRYRWIFK